MNRREALRTLAAGGAAGLVTAGAVVAAGPAMAVHDPLFALISEYRTARGRAYSIEDPVGDDQGETYEAFCASTVDPLFWRLAKETPKATTAAGALAALQLLHEGGGDEWAYDKSLLEAAMHFLEGRAS